MFLQKNSKELKSMINEILFFNNSGEIKFVILKKILGYYFNFMT